jgi:hypothetical protein
MENAKANFPYSYCPSVDMDPMQYCRMKLRIAQERKTKRDEKIDQCTQLSFPSAEADQTMTVIPNSKCRV